MANPGGKSTMLGHWRMVLRQAEEAAKAGRYDEALVLTSRPDVADHQHAVRLRTKLTLDLIARAARRGECDDLAGAIDDLNLAERQGAAPDTLAAARLSLADKVASEVRGDLDAGEPARVVDRVEWLAGHKIGGPSLRRTREIAEAWQAALDEARRGEFGRAQDQLDRAERLAAGAAKTALESTKRDVETKRKAAASRVEALYHALAAGRWPEVLTTAELVLEIVPEHPAARQARTRAWQQIAAISPSASWPDRGARIPMATERAQAEPTPPPVEPGRARWINATLRSPFVPSPSPSPTPSPSRSHQPPQVTPAPIPAQAGVRPPETGPRGRFLMWVDAVGGYLVCLDDEVILGRAGPDSPADVPLMGDLSRHHATLVRCGDSYLLRAQQPTFVNGRQVETTPLRDGDVIRLGSTVELEFRQPSPISSTARLSIVSRHRLPLAVDGVLLMAETCIIDGSPQAHITAPGLEKPVVLYRQADALWCRAAGGFEVDGRACAARAPLTLQSSILGDGFSFSLEALGTRSV